MSLVTRCPECSTAFRVLPAQLSARAGRVRCGKCAKVFDGVAHLTQATPRPEPDEPSPQIGLFDPRGWPTPEAIAAEAHSENADIGAQQQLEAAALEATRRYPARFDHTKLFPGSSWEFCRWDRVDTIGFVVCCALSAAIVGLFLFVLKSAAP